MSLARPTRTLLARCPSAIPQPAAATIPQCRHQFHTTPAVLGKRRSRFKNITAEKMGLVQGSRKLDEYTQKKFPDYTEDDKTDLQQIYTPEQYAAVEAAEAAIDPKDFALQGRLRDDPYRPGYFDDFSVVQPVIDLKSELKATPEPVRWLSHDTWAHDFMNKMSQRVEQKLESKMAGAMARAIQRVRETEGDMIDVTDEELRFFEKNPKEAEKLLQQQINMKLDKLLPEPREVEGEELAEAEAEGIPTAGEMAVRIEDVKQAMRDNDARLQELSDRIDQEFFQDLAGMFENDQPNPLAPTKLELWKEVDGSGDRRTSALAPQIKRIPGFETMYAQNKNDEAMREDNPEHTEKLLRATGMTLMDIKRLMIKPLDTCFVTNQTRLGKIASLRVIMMAGNGDGWLGIGIGKSTNSETANLMARLLAIRNMKPIRRYENRTVYGDLRTKISGTVVEMGARPPGFGLRVSHRIFEMCRAVGIHDLGARITRSRNPMNTIKAAYQCLLNQPDPEKIAAGRGMKLVDCRKVYWGGNVL